MSILIGIIWVVCGGIAYLFIRNKYSKEEWTVGMRTAVIVACILLIPALMGLLIMTNWDKPAKW